MHSPLAEEYITQSPRDMPDVVPSQWKLGAALDQLRFPQYGGDWDMVMARASGRPYEPTFPRCPSPLSQEDAARKFFQESHATRPLTLASQASPR